MTGLIGQVTAQSTALKHTHNGPRSSLSWSAEWFLRCLWDIIFLHF